VLQRRSRLTWPRAGPGLVPTALTYCVLHLAALREDSTCLDIALGFGWIGEPVAADLRDRLGALRYGATR
jgi:hypothetical protein